MQLKKYFSPYLFVSLLLSMLCMYAVQTTLLVNCDLNWLMLATRRLLQGGMYSSTYFETNPPLILFISMPPVILSYLFSIDIVTLSKGYIVCLALLSFAICYPLIQNIFRKDAMLSHWFCLLLLFVYFCLPISELGQREHLTVLFCMPYLLAVAYQLQGNSISRSQGIAYGLLAAIGFSIKPFYLLTPLAIEVYLIFQKKKSISWLRPETMAAAIFMLLYGVFVLLFFRDYLFVMVPYISRYYYSGHIMTLQTMLRTPSVYYMAVVLAAIYLKQKTNPYSHLMSILMITCVTFYAAYLYQWLPTYYKLLPVLSIWVLLSGMIFYQYVTEAYQGKLNFRHLSMLGLVLLGFYLEWQDAIQTTIVLLKNYFFGFYGVLAFLLVYYARYREPLGLLKTLIIVACITASSIVFSNYIARSELYTHHFSLTISFMTLVFALSLPSSLISRKSFVATFVLGALIFAYPTYYVVVQYYLQKTYADARRDVVDYLQTLPAHNSVYFFSTETLYTFPTLDYAKLQNASRMPFFWMLPGMMLKEGEANPGVQFQKDKDFLINIIAEDLTRNKPEYIFIDNKNKYIVTGHFNYIDYFFDNAKMRPIWKNYQYMTSIVQPPFYNFKIYRRIAE